MTGDMMRNGLQTAAETVDNVNLTLDAARHEAAIANGIARDVESHIADITPDASALMNSIIGQLESLGDPLALIAVLISPLQILMGVDIVLKILTTLNIVRGPETRMIKTANEIKYVLEELTKSVNGVRDEIRKGNILQEAINITKGTMKR